MTAPESQYHRFRREGALDPNCNFGSHSLRGGDTRCLNRAEVYCEDVVHKRPEELMPLGWCIKHVPCRRSQHKHYSPLGEEIEIPRIKS